MPAFCSYTESLSPNLGAMPFGGVWSIGSTRYPVGMGKSKQEAKQNAAKKAVDTFLKKGSEFYCCKAGFPPLRV